MFWSFTKLLTGGGDYVIMYYWPLFGTYNVKLDRFYTIKLIIPVLIDIFYLFKIILDVTNSET